MTKKEDNIKDLTSIKGIGEAKAEQLKEEGFDSVDKIRKASVKDLTKVDGISEKTANKILEQVTVTKKEPEKEESKEKQEKKKEETEKPEKETKEEEKEEYKVKKKPKLSEEIKKKLDKREEIKNRRPDFVRQESFRYKRIPNNWRRPKGYRSKKRLNYKYRGSKAKIGFRSPKEVRGLHPSGFEEVIVHNTKDIEEIDPEKQAARIGSTVGTKKRREIEKKAEEQDIRILNKSSNKR